MDRIIAPHGQSLALFPTKKVTVKMGSQLSTLCFLTPQARHSFHSPSKDLSRHGTDCIRYQNTVLKKPWPPHRNSHTDKHCRDKWEKYTLPGKIISRPFFIVMESIFRLFDYTWLWGLENQTLTVSIYRNWLAAVYSYVSSDWAHNFYFQKLHPLHSVQTANGSGCPHWGP